MLAASKFDGQLRVDRPLVLQGYKVIKDDIAFISSSSTDKNKASSKQGGPAERERTEEQIPTYLNISIGLEPLIRLPRENDKDYYHGKEPPAFLQKGNAWIK